MVRYLELIQEQTFGIAIVMEDNNAVELTPIIPPQRFSNQEFLEIAIQIVQGLIEPIFKAKGYTHIRILFLLCWCSYFWSWHHPQGYEKWAIFNKKSFRSVKKNERNHKQSWILCHQTSRRTSKNPSASSLKCFTTVIPFTWKYYRNSSYMLQLIF